MFKLAKSETFKVQVKTFTPMEKGGWEEESFFAIFKRTDESEREELIKLSNVDLMRRVMVGWVMEESRGQPVEFNEENFEAFLLITGAVRESAITYWKHNVGAKEKN